MVNPYYNKSTQAGIRAHYRYIADRVDLPILLYNVPSRTGIAISPETCAVLSEHPRIVGIKEASSDIIKIARIRRACGDDFTVWSGNDDAIVPAMSLGARGVISVLSNLCPTEAIAITNACQAGDYHTAGLL